jgi:hypothetical protein
MCDRRFRLLPLSKNQVLSRLRMAAPGSLHSRKMPRFAENGGRYIKSLSSMLSRKN